MKGLILLFCISLTLCLFGREAFASYLTITGDRTLTTSTENGIVTIKGTYRIENRGDELAIGVFPSLAIGNWIWSGDPKSLSINSSEKWEILDSFPLSKLSCAESSFCAGQNLPSSGLFPLFITHHYEDANGVRFSAVEIEEILVGQVLKEVIAPLRAVREGTRIACDKSRDSFTCNVDIINNASAKKKYSVGIHATQELQVITPPHLVVVGAGEVGHTSLEIKNFSGLIGSSYATFIVLQSEEGEFRKSSHYPFTLNITAESPLQSTLIIVGIVAALSVLLLYRCAVRIKRS